MCHLPPSGRDAASAAENFDEAFADVATGFRRPGAHGDLHATLRCGQ